MSWANIIKNKNNKKQKKNDSKKNKKKKIELENNEDLNSYFKPDKYQYFEENDGSKIFDEIYNIKTECEKNTPWLFNKITTYEIYSFLRDYIEIEVK